MDLLPSKHRRSQWQRYASNDCISMTVSLGPIGKNMPDVPDNPQMDGYGHNPRCLRRDVNHYVCISRLF